MKGIAVFLAALLVLLIVAAFLLPVGMPDGDALLPGRAEGPSGALLVGENRLFSSRIYALREGQITAIYRECRLEKGTEHRIERIASDGEQVYLLRFRGTLSQDWELLRLRMEEKSPKLLCGGRFESPLQVTQMTVVGDICHITGLLEDGSVCVYTYDDGRGMTLEHIVPPERVQDMVSAGYESGRLYVTDRFGDSYWISLEDGAEREIAPARGAEMPLDMEGGLLLCKKAVLLSALALWGLMALLLLIAGLLSHKSRQLAVRMLAAGGCCTLIVLLAAGCYVLYRELTLSGGEAMLRALPRVGIIGACAWAGTLLLLWITARSSTRSLKELVWQMDRIADGNISPREIGPGNDELHRMGRALQEMCMSLSIRNYEVNSTLRTYNRFVPQRLAELLDRAVVAEVSLGDSRRITDHIGLFSMGNRDSARGILTDDVFVEFINHSVGLLCDCLRNNNGALLSGGLRLSCMESIFSRSANDGVQAGLDFLGQAQRQYKSGLPAPELFLLLHKATLLYGLSGREERLFPYLSSSELDFLGSYSQRLYEAGAHIVVTEAYLQETEGFSSRYIGFVSDKDRDCVYKLYEILDAYPEQQRNQRLQYDHRFQEALRLFYSNDFYLARNLFSALVRSCPEDGIARWYLFACEHLFNQEEGGTPDYSLFGIRV